MMGAGGANETLELLRQLVATPEDFSKRLEQLQAKEASAASVQAAAVAAQAEAKADKAEAEKAIAAVADTCRKKVGQATNEAADILQKAKQESDALSRENETCRAGLEATKISLAGRLSSIALREVALEADRANLIAGQEALKRASTLLDARGAELKTQSVDLDRREAVLIALNAEYEAKLRALKQLVS